MRHEAAMASTEPAREAPAGPLPSPNGGAARSHRAVASAARSRPAGRRRTALRLAVGLAVAALVWLGLWLWRAAQPPAPTVASGVIEAEEVAVSSEIAGRLVALAVTEGQQVAAGTELARLDDSRVRLQITLGDAAARRELDLESEKYILRAPLAGQVLRVVARVGEFTAPGQPVLVIADLAEVEANLYVPVRDLGQVRVGQTVVLTADPYPGRTFPGVVTSINPKAEYTPRNVQNQRDRLNLVFGVTARVDNRAGALLPGLPIQATFRSDAPGR